MKNGEQKSWLKRLQEGSWEPELFISGILLFALFQIPDALSSVQHTLDTYISPFFTRSNIDESYLEVLNTSVYFLIVGFTIHIFLRTIWAAYIGISYVYEDGIRKEHIGYDEFYKKRLPDSDYIENIKTLERYCSLIFSFSYLGFGIVIGMFVFMAIMGVIVYGVYTLAPESWLIPYFDSLLTLAILIYLLDIASAGMIRRVPYLSKAFIPIHFFNRYLFVYPLYEKVYVGIISNHRLWKVMLLMTSVVLALVLSLHFQRKGVSNLQLANLNNDTYLIYAGHYENLFDDRPSKGIYIQSDIIESNVLRVSIPHNVAFEEREIFPLCNYENQEPTDSLKMACLNQFYDITINDSLYTTEGFYFRQDRYNIEGLRLWVDISHLERGQHTLALKYNFYDEEADTIRLVTPSVVEFFKESKKDQSR